MPRRVDAGPLVTVLCVLVVLAPIASAVGGAGVGGSAPASGGGGGGPECPPPVACGVGYSGSTAAPPPPWYTQAIHLKVLAAREEGLGYNAALDEYVPVNVSFIRPGAWMVWPQWCTMGFVTDDNEILTAGHCFDELQETVNVDVKPLDIHEKVNVGRPIRELERTAINPETDQTVVLAVGSEKAPDVFVGIGTADEPKKSPDYAVVKIDDAWLPNVDPTVDKILGPEGPVYDSEYGMDGETTVSESNPLIVKYVGHGTGIGTGGMPRIGRVTRIDNGLALCNCTFVPGDSGGPVLVVNEAEPLGRAYGLIKGGIPDACLAFKPTECASIQMLSEIPESVVEQRVPEPKACQGEFRFTFTSDLERGTIPEEVWDLSVPYVMVYDDQNHNNRMDQGERFENKLSEAWWIAQESVRRAGGQTQSRSSAGSSGTANFQSCGDGGI